MKLELPSGRECEVEVKYTNGNRLNAEQVKLAVTCVDEQLQRLKNSSDQNVEESIQEMFVSLSKANKPVPQTTKISFTITNGEQELGKLEGEATCHPDIMFAKIEGRRQALRKAFDKDEDRTLLSKEDRTVIAQRLVVDLIGSRSDRRRRANAAKLFRKIPLELRVKLANELLKELLNLEEDDPQRRDAYDLLGKTTGVPSTTASN